MINPAILKLILSSLPQIVGFIQGLHAGQHPLDPPLTDADVIATLQALVGSSKAIDDQWLAQHG